MFIHLTVLGFYFGLIKNRLQFFLYLFLLALPYDQHSFFFKICLLLTWLNSADLQATGCDPGQVRDLDGTCVKKVTFPPRGERKRCPEPRVLNGNHFFGADGRSVNFFCETDHILVPENRVNQIIF